MSDEGEYVVVSFVTVLSDQDALDLVQADLIAGPVIELGYRQ